MTALSADSQLVEAQAVSKFTSYPLSVSQVLYYGALVVIDSRLGTATEAASLLQGHLRCVGVARGELPAGSNGTNVTASTATATAAGTPNVLVEEGRFTFINGATVDALAAADVGSICYAIDDATVSKASLNGNRPIAGVFRGLTAGGRCIVDVGDNGNRFSGETVQLLASASLALLQYSQVKGADTAGLCTVVGATAATDEVIGILLNAPASGDPAIIAVSGFAPCVVGSAGVTAGGAFNATTAGAQLTSAAAKHVTGISLETGTSAQTKMVLIRSGQIAA